MSRYFDAEVGHPLFDHLQCLWVLHWDLGRRSRLEYEGGGVGVEIWIPGMLWGEDGLRAHLVYTRGLFNRKLGVVLWFSTRVHD